MDKEKLQQLLTQLQEALDDPDIDEETVTLARQLDSGIHQLLDEQSEVQDPDPFLQLSRRMEADFASRHPLAERVLREIGNTLANIGI